MCYFILFNKNPCDAAITYTIDSQHEHVIRSQYSRHNGGVHRDADDRRPCTGPRAHLRTTPSPLFGLTASLPPSQAAARRSMNACILCEDIGCAVLFLAPSR